MITNSPPPQSARSFEGDGTFEWWCFMGMFVGCSLHVVRGSNACARLNLLAILGPWRRLVLSFCICHRCVPARCLRRSHRLFVLSIVQSNQRGSTVQLLSATFRVPIAVTGFCIRETKQQQASRTPAVRQRRMGGSEPLRSRTAPVDSWSTVTLSQ